MSFRVVYSRNAEEEIETAYRWIRDQAPIAAEKWRDALIARIETLSNNPLGHRLAAESANFSREIRQLLYGKRAGQYRILYTVDHDAVVVLSLRHSRRRPLAEGDLPI